MRRVWGKDYDGYLDYVTAWHVQAMKLLKERRGEFAFVTTNSITQGQPVPALFAPLFREGWRIKFAHRTFAWDSEAPGKAGVHCVVIGFSRDRGVKQRLWDYPDVKEEPIHVPVQEGINSYLIDGPNILVKKAMRPISPLLPQAAFGSKPADGGNLIVEADEYEEVINDTVAAKYVRPFKMGRELVQGLDRWCLWLEDLDPADVAKSQVLRTRIDACKKFRESSSTGGDAYQRRETPHLMKISPYRPTVPYVGIPAVVSEARRFYTVDHLDAHVIAGNKIFTAIDPDGLLFALNSSSMFITWQRAVGGRLESRLSFSNTLVWNTFPVPELDDATRKKIIKAGQGVLAARELHPERSLADHYNPLAMDPALLKAHDALDRVVDKAMGATRKLTTERQRQEILFQNYSRLTR